MGRERRKTRGRLRRGQKKVGKNKRGRRRREVRDPLAAGWVPMGRRPLRGTTAAQKPAYAAAR